MGTDDERGRERDFKMNAASNRACGLGSVTQLFSRNGIATWELRFPTENSLFTHPNTHTTSDICTV